MEKKTQDLYYKQELYQINYTGTTDFTSKW